MFCIILLVRLDVFDFMIVLFNVVVKFLKFFIGFNLLVINLENVLIVKFFVVVFCFLEIIVLKKLFILLVIVLVVFVS